MNALKSLALAALLAVGVSAAFVHADYYTPRQYYGGWNKHPSKDYYYNYYYYKPAPDYAGYKHHYVMYYPSRPTYYYYYNPQKKVFWGRCPTKYDGYAPQYSMLPEEVRKPKIEDIPEKDFPKPGPLPVIPDVDKKEPNPPTLDLPPDKPAPTQAGPGGTGKIDQGEDLP